MQCLDCLNWDAPYTVNDIANITPNDINAARNEYLESNLSDSITKGLGEVTIPKLVGNKWMEFKTAMTESLSWIIGKNKIPLTYLVMETALGIFNIPYNNRMECLIACTVHRGAAFTSNNSDLYSLDCPTHREHGGICPSSNSWTKTKWMTSMAWPHVPLRRSYLYGAHCSGNPTGHSFGNL